MIAEYELNNRRVELYQSPRSLAFVVKHYQDGDVSYTGLFETEDEATDLYIILRDEMVSAFHAAHVMELA